MTKGDFISKIKNGRDIMIDVGKKHYTILTWPKEGIVICEQNTQNEKTYDSAEQLMNNFRVEGKTLAERVSQIVITDYS